MLCAVLYVSSVSAVGHAHIHRLSKEARYYPISVKRRQEPKEGFTCLYLTMYDITDTEEATLPLPTDWVKTTDAEGAALYRNTKTNVLSSEHPYIQHGAAMTDKLPVPEGWVLKEAAEQELFFYHAATGRTGWDHPQLRYCVARILSQHGYDIIGAKLLEKSPAGVIEPAWHLLSSPAKTNGNNITEQYTQYQGTNVEHTEPTVSPSRDIKHMNWVDMMQQLENTLQDDGYSESPPDHMYEPDAASDVSSSSPSNSYDDYNRRYSEEGDSLAYSNSDVYTGDLEFNLSPTELTVSKRSKKWDELKATMKTSQGNAMARNTSSGSHGISMPQINAAGIAILNSRIRDANTEIQNLLLQIRTILCHSQDIDCSTLNTLDSRLLRGSSHNTLRLRELTERAGHIIGYLRYQPKLLVPALGTLWNTSGPVMVATLSFIIFNRMLHPCSTDGFMTTAFLLEAVNYQVEDTADVVNVFHKVDPRVLMSRAIFISDSKVALSWDPLVEPMPLMTVHNTLLSCALKAYSVRRDVSSYFRATWKPVIPALVSILEPVTPMSISESQAKIREAEQDRIVSVSNISSIAFKLIEVLMLDENMVLFPVSATAMCRTMYELCGLDGVHSYILYFLILPNLVKLLLGHHDSADNEDVIRYNPSGVHLDAYFDKSVWFRNYKAVDINAADDHVAVSQDGRIVYDPISVLLWSTWRLYGWALLMDGAALTTLTAAEFFEPFGIDRKSLPMNDVKIRNLIARTRTKIDNGVSLLLKLPMDSHACSFLELNPCAGILGLEKRSKNVAQLLARRLSSLLLKPDGMTMHLVISDYELHMLFQSVVTLLDASGQDGFEELMEGISRYEHISERLGLEREETIMLLKIAHESNDQVLNNEANDISVGRTFLAENNLLQEDVAPLSSLSDIEVEYHRLARGLKLSQKYLESLTRLHRRLENDAECTLTELVEDDTWYYSPEYEFDYHVDNAACRKKKTQAWASKEKPSLHGLTGMLQQQQATLRAKESHITLIKQEEQFFKSYRDSSNEHSVTNAYTVHNKNTVNKTKPKKSSQPRYTKVTLDPNAKFTAPTMSAISKTSAPVVHTSADLYEKYIKSFRSDGSDEVSSKRHIINAKPVRGNEYYPESVGPGSIASTKKSCHSAPPAPFPEHLRHRVRSSNGSTTGEENDGFLRNSRFESTERNQDNESSYKERYPAARPTVGIVPGSKFDASQPRYPKIVRREPGQAQKGWGLFSPESNQQAIPAKLANRFCNRASADDSVSTAQDDLNSPGFEPKIGHFYVENSDFKEEVLFASDALNDMSIKKDAQYSPPRGSHCASHTPDNEVLYSPESPGASSPGVGPASPISPTALHHTPLSNKHDDWFEQEPCAVEEEVLRDTEPVPRKVYCRRIR